MREGIVQEVFEKTINRNIDRFKLTKDNSFVIIPFDLYAGFVSNSEIGVHSENIEVKDFSTFQRIFTGRENLLAVWTNSTSIKNNGSKDKEFFFDRKRKVGDYFRAYGFTKEGGTSFTPSPMDNQFIQENPTGSIDCTTYREFTEKDKFKLYIVPKFTEGTDDNLWMYLIDFKTNKNPETGKFFLYNFNIRWCLQQNLQVQDKQ